jgi:copper homeostasis protein
MIRLEIACFDLNSALTAAKANVDRIEFCSDYNLGGITPNKNEFIALKQQTNIPIYVMIRPRGGDFVYNNHELEQMVSFIEEFKQLGADGFVFGCLNTENELDIDANKKLLQACDGLPCTFHRAIDKTSNIISSLETLIQLGFAAVLSSGGKSQAQEGIDLLKEMQHVANNKLDIVCGGGVRSSNILELKNMFQPNYFHSSGITNGTTSNYEEIIKLKTLLHD